MTLAETLTGLGEPGEAWPLLRRTVALQEKSYGSDLPRRVVTLKGLAVTPAAFGNLEKRDASLARARGIENRAGSEPGRPSASEPVNLLGSSER